ncbi:hypothetical protein [Butyrivibrio sp. INlla16]|uniref:hypothetical protein n=1 Tax=Butyrivibrio sp. INlla16 TaxID=1520807 RepID=UPI000886F5E2|nr:hypothetical protein [Butyrivibrio sp. INlla16]SDB37372.1 hypothetical protein SAMN02910263_01797 [Butyrivibrio sp. INlla16]
MYEIGSEFNLEKTTERKDLTFELSEVAEKAGRYIEFLRCGRDAIGFVADDIIARFQDDGINPREEGALTAFLPALACDSMVLPFEVRGFKLVYYKVKEGLSIDVEDLFFELEKEKGVGSFKPVILIMNYFGVSDTADAAKSIRERCSDAVIIEDVTHILFDDKAYLTKNAIPDYQVGSIRKWLGVPDGAFAVSKSEFLMGALTGETDFTALRLEALTEKSEYLEKGDPELKVHFRKLLSDAEDSLSDGLDPYHMSDVSAELLSDLDTYRMSDRRRANYRSLYKLLSEMPLCGKAFSLLPEIPEVYEGEYKYTPFMLPIVLDIDFMRRSAITEAGKNITRDGFERILAEKGVYAPVLWPILPDAAKACESSAHFSDNMLTFWIDQRYNRFDMEQIAAVLGEELSRL